jgi:small subunit ribosomal protein S1
VLEAQVLEVDEENRKLRLGIKQLTEDPWEKLEDVFVPGTIHTGTIIRMVEKGAVVELEYGIEGFAQSKGLKVADGQEELKEASQAAFMVLEYNKETKKLSLSHTRTWQTEDPEAKAAAAAKKKTSKKKDDGEDIPFDAEALKGKSGEKETLGDLSALAALRDNLKAEEATAEAKPKKKASKKAEAAEAQEAPAEEAPAEETAAE